MNSNRPKHKEYAMKKNNLHIDISSSSDQNYEDESYRESYPLEGG